MLVTMENYYLVAKELSNMSKKFETKISQYRLVDCVSHEVVMEIKQKQKFSYLYVHTCSWQQMLQADEPDPIASSNHKYPNYTHELYYNRES